MAVRPSLLPCLLLGCVGSPQVTGRSEMMRFHRIQSRPLCLVQTTRNSTYKSQVAYCCCWAINVFNCVQIQKPLMLFGWGKEIRKCRLLLLEDAGWSRLHIFHWAIRCLFLRSSNASTQSNSALCSECTKTVTKICFCNEISFPCRSELYPKCSAQAEVCWQTSAALLANVKKNLVTMHWILIY